MPNNVEQCKGWENSEQSNVNNFNQKIDILHFAIYNPRFGYAPNTLSIGRSI